MRKFLIGLLIFIILFVSAAAAIFFGLGFFLSPQSPLQKSDAVVAISGGETDSRAREAVRLYKQGWAPKLIFSGAALDPSGPSNARAMERLALGQGVPPADILLDENSTNTAQNAEGVAAIVKNNGYHRIILVTSPYHQRRASITFRQVLGANVQILNHSTTDQAWRRSEWWASGYSINLTISELQKTLFVAWSNR